MKLKLQDFFGKIFDDTLICKFKIFSVIIASFSLHRFAPFLETESENMLCVGLFKPTARAPQKPFTNTCVNLFDHVQIPGNN